MISPENTPQRIAKKHPAKGTLGHFRHYFLQSYRSLRWRCLKGPIRYRGKPFMSKEDWAQFLLNTSNDRAELYELWRASNFCRRLAPSIDRVNSKEGYLIWNCRWLPQYQNSRGHPEDRMNKTTCKNGHPWVESNIYREPNPKQPNKRTCITCKRVLEAKRPKGRKR